MRKKIKLLSVILCVLALTGCNKSSQNELTISVATSLLNPINEIIKELEKKPISIKILNTRVDTARDLVLKLYGTANELVKTASMAEMAIVYGNKYRSTFKDVNNGLEKAEKEFFKGEYRNSLEIILNTLNVVEPGIHKKLLNAYESK